MQPMHGLNELREQGRMTWIEAERGWGAEPEDIVDALSSDGFEECKRETTTSRRDLRPAGGVWRQHLGRHRPARKAETVRGPRAFPSAHSTLSPAGFLGDACAPNRGDRVRSDA